MTDATGVRRHAVGRNGTAAGRAVFIGATVVFALVALPVVVRGAPLSDDLVNCLDPERAGLASFLGDSFERLGILRRAHLLEIVITNLSCERLTFGAAIALTAVLSGCVAVLLRGLLRELAVPEPWASAGGALYLLQPLGTEAALWPAAMHIPFGLAAALGALRLHRSGRHGWGTVAVLVAVLSVEQVVLALPLAAWFVTPRARRPRAVWSTVGVVVLVVAVAVIWPGDDPRLRVGLAERVAGLVSDPLFVIALPAVGIGAASIPLAAAWAFPWSVAVITTGAVAGGAVGRSAPDAPSGSPAGRDAWPVVYAAGCLVAASLAPVVLSVPHQGSPRVFTPTWLVLSATIPMVAARLRRGVVVGVALGAFASGAALSMALSAFVRVRTADIVEHASYRIAAEASTGETVALCGVTRTVVDPAPRGSFAVSEFIYPWAAERVVRYYTGEDVHFVLAGELWNRPCPSEDEVDRIFWFADLVEDARVDA